MLELTVAFGIAVLVITILILYIALLRQQLRNINQQLDKRLTKNTRQPISLELVNRDLNQLAANVNKCLKAEENLRLEGVREEKRFKELITNLSHDLRTPLTAIKGYQQLMEKGELTEDQKIKLRIANKHCEELGRLIEHFYEYTYLVNVEPELNLDRMNLTNLVIEILVESVTKLEEHNLTVHFDESTPVFILGDKEMVIRIVRNLIRNCLQHSDGDIEVQLVSGESAVLSFGNLVKKDAKIEPDRLFDRFYVGDSARGNSTGLGLSIVKLLAEQMNGSVDATLNGGWLEIRVRLPLA